MTRTGQAIIDDARTAGYEIRPLDKDGEAVLITRGDGRNYRGILMYGDGIAYDLSWSVCGKTPVLRTYKAMRKVLGISQHSPQTEERPR